MTDQFVPIGKRSPQVIAKYLRALGYEQNAALYEARANPPGKPLNALSVSGGLQVPNLLLGANGSQSPSDAWLNTEHQFGFIPPFIVGSGQFQPIVSASNMQADHTLSNKRINITIERIHVYAYPEPWISFGNNVHTIHFTFEAQNQVADPGGGAGVAEAAAFSRVYTARSGQDVGDFNTGIFIGLVVGANGVNFSCETINVSNSNDQAIVNGINSSVVTDGLNLLTTAQPVLAPFVGMVKGLTTSLIQSSDNTPVQKFRLGLDFDTGNLGARIAEGSYIATQVSQPGEINWSDWKFDTQSDTVVRPADPTGGGALTFLPYNAIIFRVTKYQS